MDDDGAIDDPLKPGQVESGVGEEERVVGVGGRSGGNVHGPQFPGEVADFATLGCLRGTALAVTHSASWLVSGIVVRTGKTWTAKSNSVVLPRLGREGDIIILIFLKSVSGKLKGENLTNFDHFVVY